MILNSILAAASCSVLGAVHTFASSSKLVLQLHQLLMPVRLPFPSNQQHHHPLCHPICRCVHLVQQHIPFVCCIQVFILLDAGWCLNIKV